jgi:hypothetical protein
MKKMGDGINCQKRETLIKFIIITLPFACTGWKGREGGREGGAGSEGGAFAAFISSVLASALLQHLEPSLSLSLFSLLSSLLSLPTPAFFFLVGYSQK